jgi:hypothetical protein
MIITFDTSICILIDTETALQNSESIMNYLNMILRLPSPSKSTLTQHSCEKQRLVTCTEHLAILRSEFTRCRGQKTAQSFKPVTSQVAKFWLEFPSQQPIWWLLYPILCYELMLKNSVNIMKLRHESWYSP